MAHLPQDLSEVIGTQLRPTPPSARPHSLVAFVADDEDVHCDLRVVVLQDISEVL